MYPTGRDFITSNYRRKDRMKQAEKELLIRIAQNKASNQAPIHQRMIVSIGTWLEQLGCRLKSNYVEVADLEIQRTTLS
ncbi:MAG: hypothetical protein MUO58_12550 [Anaerolineales bacterium]|nr:hypothetical protein [Anaerolineales bacterium]